MMEIIAAGLAVTCAALAIAVTVLALLYTEERKRRRFLERLRAGDEYTTEASLFIPEIPKEQIPKRRERDGRDNQED